jgi:hypothetical protein
MSPAKFYVGTLNARRKYVLLGSISLSNPELEKMWELYLNSSAQHLHGFFIDPATVGAKLQLVINYTSCATCQP